MWDKIYNSPEYMYGKQPNLFLQESTRYLPQGKILCLGDGEGRNSVYLATCGYEVTAVDLSAVALEKARRLADEHQVQVDYIQANLEDYDLGENLWDGIVSIFCHLPSSLRTKVNQAITTGLKPGGVYLIEGYTPKQLDYKTGGPPSSDMMISAQILSAELNSLQAFMLTEKERFILEGQKHNGRSHVVQGIFAKVTA